MSTKNITKTVIKSAKPAKKTSNLVVPLDPKLKKIVQLILAELGLNQSQLVTSLYKEVARTRKIPLSFDLKDEWVNAREATPEEAKAIQEGLDSGVASEEEVADLEKLLGIKLSY